MVRGDAPVSWGQLGASSSQLGGVFRSGPVWQGPSGYRAVPAALVGRWGHVLGQRPGGWFSMEETAKGAVGASDGSDTMVLNHGLGRFRNEALGLGRFRNEAFGLGRADHDQDLYVQTWTVVRERHREGSSHEKMCGDWVIIDKCEVLIAYCANCELMID
ncbi:hypothetical protein F2Q70_00013350 [Brassica cretica]|uniref:Uncharacterized protein n=1 Tax=Brassica cretica TaxID=69181 RepID=A0A8S9MCN0_BRACR|nr:hypothetical protein F2Q70_00013350 [Brassica cretica]